MSLMKVSDVIRNFGMQNTHVQLYYKGKYTSVKKGYDYAENVTFKDLEVISIEALGGCVVLNIYTEKDLCKYRIENEEGTFVRECENKELLHEELDNLIFNNKIRNAHFTYFVKDLEQHKVIKIEDVSSVNEA